MARILDRLRIRYQWGTHVGPYEVDFLVARHGRPGLIIEVDGDMYHFDEAKRARRDQRLRSFGWDIHHVWASAVLKTPALVEAELVPLLEGAPRTGPTQPKKKRTRKRGPRTEVVLPPTPATASRPARSGSPPGYPGSRPGGIGENAS